ncbi:MAG: hypothetical protein M3O91_08695, partial [Chloroflexota bacterium]|nr:hypothetical protein [Chloroflexota bacterium]
MASELHRLSDDELGATLRETAGGEEPRFADVWPAVRERIVARAARRRWTSLLRSPRYGFA